MSSSNFKLSSSVTVARYLQLESAEDRKALGLFIQERFNERYFKPVEDSKSKHGFTLMTVACLVIETLESFYQGRSDTRNHSKQMFRDFFDRDTPLKAFKNKNNWFFQDIRCGLLHQAEARSGWRILRHGPLIDKNAKTINSTLFLQELRKAVAVYSNQIVVDDVIWERFKKKMNAICKNCT